MHPVRTLFLVACTILAFAVSAPLVSAQSSSPAAEAPNALHLTKDCSTFSGQPGSSCTITSSNLEAIPVGGLQIYYGPQLANPMFMSSSVVLDAGDGNTEFGYCMVDMHDPNGAPHGMCTYWAGTGSLTGFNAVVNVTVDDAGAWHLDGTYLFAPTQ